MTLGALAGVLNSNFVLESLLPGSAGRAVSELSVPGQPWSMAFRICDGSSAVLVMVLAAGLLRAGRRAPGQVAGAWLLLVTGATTLVSALVPLTCLATAGPVCASSPPGSAAPLPNLVHDGVSITGTTAAILAAALLAAVSTGRQRWAHAVAFVAAGGLGLALAVGAQGQVPAWFGVTQRAQILVLSLWFVVVGYCLASPARRAAGTMAP